MKILFVESHDDRAMLITDKLGSRGCTVERAKGIIEASCLIGLEDFDLVIISDLSQVTPINSFLYRLRKHGIPYAYLVPRQSEIPEPTNDRKITVDDLGNGALDKLVGAGV